MPDTPNSNGSGRSTPLIAPEWLAQQRNQMVEQQLRNRGIRDERVLEAMRKIPRHEFVGPEQMAHAYEDRPLAIGQGQTISQPFIVGLMVEALDLRGTEKVLEVGTGSGYQAAVLAALARRVVSVEMDTVLAASARQRITRMGIAVTIIEADGTLGYSPEAPYDGIIVAAAAPEIPQPYLEQLSEEGRLVIPVGDLSGQELRLVRKAGGELVTRSLGYCRFVPLTGRWGWQEGT